MVFNKKLEQSLILYITIKYCFQRAWIGLHADSWRWSLSDPSFYKPGETEFRQWGTGEPNAGYSEKVCTGMHPDGLWYDDLCEYGIFPVCADIKGENIN